jgi:hypothetical protein
LEKGKNIEEIFKQAFENHQASVPDGLFSKIKSQLDAQPGSSVDSGASGGETISGAAGSGISAVGIISIVAASVALVGGIYYFTTQNQAKETVKEVVAEQEIPQAESIDFEEALAEFEQEQEQEKGVQEVSVESTPEREEEVNAKPSLPIQEQVVLSEPIVANTSNEDSNQAQEERSDKGTSESSAADVSSSATENQGGTTTSEVSSSSTVQTAVKQEKINKEHQLKEAFDKGKLIANTTQGNAPLDVHFLVDIDRDGLFLWDLGNGNYEEGGKKKAVSFQEEGSYQVSVCLDDACKYITIEVAPEIISKIGPLPNTFSPNHDGINDLYVVSTEGIKSFNLQVMDMKGNTVFESLDPRLHWDGRDKFGNDLPVGNYICIIFAVGEDDKDFVLRQNVRLTR